jgi:hypothetical protein
MLGIRLWNELRGSELPPPAEDLAKWEAEFNKLMNSQREELDDDYGEAMQRVWENGIGDYESEPSKMQFDDGGVPILEDYVFGLSFDYRAMNLRFTPYLQTKKIPIWILRHPLALHLEMPSYSSKRMDPFPRPHSFSKPQFRKVILGRVATKRGSFLVKRETWMKERRLECEL